MKVLGKITAVEGFWDVGVFLIFTLSLTGLDCDILDYLGWSHWAWTQRN